MAAPVQGATLEEVEAFITMNGSELHGEALDVFKKMTPQDQKRVINDGGLRDCNNVVAVMRTRARKAREMEELLTTGKLPSAPVVAPLPGPNIFVPSPPTELAALYLHGQATEVEESERRLGTAATARSAAAEEPEKPHAMEGTVRGVGGVIEVTRAKYGCGSGSRWRVIGQTPIIWQLDGNRTVPKAHLNNGWRWILKDEPKPEDAKKSKAKEPAVKEATDKQAKDATDKQQSVGKSAADASAGKNAIEKQKSEVKEKKANGKRDASKQRTEVKKKAAKKASSSSSSSSRRKKDKRKPADKKSSRGRSRDRGKDDKKKASARERSRSRKAKRKRDSSTSTSEDSRKRRKRKSRKPRSSSSSS